MMTVQNNDNKSIDQQLHDACLMTFGGVGACSPEIYQAALERIAFETGRVFDDQFREDVRNILKDIPCPLD